MFPLNSDANYTVIKEDKPIRKKYEKWNRNFIKKKDRRHDSLTL